MRPSAAGPMPDPVQASSDLVSVPACWIPPHDTTFLAQACGRAVIAAPVLPCDWQMTMS